VSRPRDDDPPIPPGALGVIILYPAKYEAREVVRPDGQRRIELTVEQPYRIKVDERLMLRGLALYRPKIV
jgi:hypothetical protein